MNLTAKEMFEALGWKIVSSKDEEVKMYFTRSDRFIYFILKDGTGYGTKHCYGGYELNSNAEKTTQLSFTIELHQAITQQIKELGWIE